MSEEKMHTCTNLFLVKGQLISKYPFGVIVCTKIPTKFFPGFLPWPLKRRQIKKRQKHFLFFDLFLEIFCWFFVANTIRTF